MKNFIVVLVVIGAFLFISQGKILAYGGGTPGLPPPVKVTLVCTFEKLTLSTNITFNIPKCKLVKINEGEYSSEFKQRLAGFFQRLQKRD